MSAPERRTVRIRRRPRLGVFIGLGAVVGAVAAVIGALAVPADPSFPTPQALGYLLLVLTPVGAVVGALVAIGVDALGARSVRTAEAERDGAAPEPDPAAPVSAVDPEPVEPAEEL